MASRAFTKGALLGSISLLALAAPALAAAPAQTGPEIVVVTATKRAEPIREVPMAVTALTGDNLTKVQAMDFADFVPRVPGMTFVASDPGHTQLVLRGINAGGVGATIGTYLDETPYGSSSALANGVITTPNLDTFDIARVEVLRGPQGTLYGSSTLGGLLKFVTNAPDPSAFDDKIEFGLNSVDHGDTGFIAKAMVNVPLASDLALRVTGYKSLDGGFVDDAALNERDVNKVHNTGGRAALLWSPTANFSIKVSGIVQNLDTDGGFETDMTPSATTGGLTFKPLLGDLEHARLANEFSDVRYRLYNATANYDLGWAALTSSTSWDTFRDHILTDDTNVLGVFVVQNLGQKKLTQEVRLASPTGTNFEWLAGLYYTHETADLLQDLVLAPHTPSLGFVELTSSYIEEAAFANFTYHFNPAFDVSLGGRYSHNSQSANETGLASAAGASKGNVFTWSVAPRWHVDDDTMVYARVAKGYRPGGPNALPPIATGVPTTYAADSLINYELGVKTDVLDHRLSLDADVFYIDWSNIQLLTVIGGFGVNANGGSAKSQGFEWNATWVPVDALTVSLSGAYTDATLTADTGPFVGAAKGERLPYIPRWSGSLDADYTFNPWGDVTPFVGGSWQFVGERDSGFDPTFGRVTLPSYNSFDLRAGVNFQDWSLELFVKNVGDERGITDNGSTGSAAAAAAAGLAPGNFVPTIATTRPRLIGVTLTGKL